MRLIPKAGVLAFCQRFMVYSYNAMNRFLVRRLPDFSFYICTVIDSFCFSQPKRHNLRLCFV